MNPSLRHAVDALFVIGWAGVIALVILLATFLVSTAAGVNSAVGDAAASTAKSFFLPTFIVWIVLTTATVIHLVRSPSLDAFHRRIWIRLLLLNFLVVGPTAYYVSATRRAARLMARLRSRQVLIALYYAALWGSVVITVLLAGLFLFGSSISLVRTLVILLTIVVPITALAQFTFLTLLLIDAGMRSEAEWTETNFARYLNPWAWVLGTRVYYREFIRRSSSDSR